MDASMYELHESIENRHWWFLGRRHIVRSILERWIPAGSRVLEVGCGTGGNLAELSGRYEMVGLDRSADAVARAARLSGCRVERGTLPDELPDLGDPFSGALLLDVLEHVENDVAAAAAVRSYLKPGGLLIITVPALQLLWSGHDVIFHHLRRYRRRELRDKLVAAGYEVRLVTYYNSLLFPPVLAVRMWKRLIGDTEARSDFTMPRPWANRMLAAIFSSEARLLGRVPLPAGASLLAVAATRSRS